MELDNGGRRATLFVPRLVSWALPAQFIGLSFFLLILMTFNEELFSLALDYAPTPKLQALKQRFEGFHSCKDHATAAAFGYLAAMEDAKKDKEAEAQEEATIGEQVFEAVEQAMEGEMGAEYAGELIMALVYKWLYEQLLAEGFESDGYCMICINNLFAPFVKSGVVH
jgi:hypothetical protein